MSFKECVGVVNAFSTTLERVRGEGSVPGVEWLYGIMKDLTKAVELAGKFEEVLSGRAPSVQRVCNWYLIKSGNTITLRRSKPLIALTCDRRSNSVSVSSSESSIKVGTNDFEVRLGGMVFRVSLSDLGRDIDTLSPLLKKVAPAISKLLDDLTNCVKASKVY